MINIVFYKIKTVDYYFDMESLEASFIESIKLHMPDSAVIQLSDTETPEVKGVDKIVRFPNQHGNSKQFVHYEGFSYLSEFNLENMLLTDTDMLYNANVEHLFEGDFDVAACPRGRDSGGTIREVNIRHPFPSIIITKNPQFWKDCSELMLSLPLRRWEDNMWAVGQVINNGKYKSKLLNGFLYNRMPHHKDDFDPDAAVFHFKSRGINDRKSFMNYFFETHIKSKFGKEN